MRTWLYSVLSTDATLMVMLPGGLRGPDSQDMTPGIKPFAVYRMGERTALLMGDDAPLTAALLCSVWVHDVPGDYLNIDAIIARIRYILLSALPQVDGAGGTSSFIRARWVTDSGDLDDVVQATIVKYTTFNIIHKPGGN